MCIIPKGKAREWWWTGKKVKTSEESRRYRVADWLVVKEGRMVRQAGTEWQTGSWSRKAEWSGRRVQSGRQARGQGRQNGQAGGYRVQKQVRVKTGRTRKRRIAKSRTGKRWLTWKHTRRTGTERDRKHRDKYTGGKKRHLEGVETITGTGETDQGVTLSEISLTLSKSLIFI
jgi:hypothetical protein